MWNATKTRHRPSNIQALPTAATKKQTRTHRQALAHQPGFFSPSFSCHYHHYKACYYNEQKTDINLENILPSWRMVWFGLALWPVGFVLFFFFWSSSSIDRTIENALAFGDTKIISSTFFCSVTIWLARASVRVCECDDALLMGWGWVLVYQCVPHCAVRFPIESMLYQAVKNHYFTIVYVSRLRTCTISISIVLARVVLFLSRRLNYRLRYCC